jgi:hypothetical protein
VFLHFDNDVNVCQAGWHLLIAHSKSQATELVDDHTQHLHFCIHYDSLFQHFQFIDELACFSFIAVGSRGDAFVDNVIYVAQHRLP